MDTILRKTKLLTVYVNAYCGITMEITEISYFFII